MKRIRKVRVRRALSIAVAALGSVIVQATAALAYPLQDSGVTDSEPARKVVEAGIGTSPSGPTLGWWMVTLAAVAVAAIITALITRHRPQALS
ncbi:MAG: hypothetical protein ACRDKZ_11470 [Actinomycetota bacterium]